MKMYWLIEGKTYPSSVLNLLSQDFKTKKRDSEGILSNRFRLKKITLI